MSNMAPSTTTVSTTTLDDAVNAALLWWDEFDALDDLDLGDTIERVTTAARQHGISTLADLELQAGVIITSLTGVTSLTQFGTNEDTNAVHLVRNVVAAILLASNILRRGRDTNPYAFFETFAPVAERHGGKNRPAYDDEILLTRTAAMHGLQRRGRTTRTAVQYALAESGANPSETTTVRACDFDSLTAPTKVDIDGVSRWYSKRTIPLTAFARHVVARGLNAHLAADPRGHQARVCFTGSTQASASASSSNNLRHLAERVGITKPSLEGSYATRWRGEKEMTDNGVEPALELVGRKKINHVRLQDFLNIPTQAVIVDDDGNDVTPLVLRGAI